MDNEVKNFIKNYTEDDDDINELFQYVSKENDILRDEIKELNSKIRDLNKNKKF